MLLFPLWFLRLLVFGGLTLCALGSLLLLAMLFLDIKHKRMW